MSDIKKIDVMWDDSPYYNYQKIWMCISTYKRCSYILDQAAGTGGMLSTANNYIKRFNPTADVRLFSQEVNPESYAMCLAEMLIRGQNVENIRLQDTMKEDCFKDIKMRFVIENPKIFLIVFSGAIIIECIILCIIRYIKESL